LATKWKRPEGTPSRTLEALAGLGLATRLSHRMASFPTDNLRAAMERERQRRADAYDAALGEALGHVQAIRDALGDSVADVVESRFIDGASWADAARAHGMTVNEANHAATRALDWLDAHRTTSKPDAALWQHAGLYRW